jgi:hypothetical protein
MVMVGRPPCRGPSGSASSSPGRFRAWPGRQEVSWLHAKPISQPDQEVQGQVGLATFDPAEVPGAHVHAVSQVLLGQARLIPQVPQPHPYQHPVLHLRRTLLPPRTLHA